MVNPERSVKIHLAQQADADCYVIGSSQEMQIDIGTMPFLAEKCQEVINLAVSGATFEDFVTAAGRVANNAHARHVFVGLHPWSFRAEADKRWTEEEQAYVEAREFFGLPKVKISGIGDVARFRNLINGAYLIRNLEELWRNVLKGAGPLSVKSSTEATDTEDIYMRTGRLVYSRSYLSDKPMPLNNIGTGEYKIGAPIFNAAAITEFERILEILNNRGIMVDFFLMPYHPKVLACGKPLVCEALKTIEALVRETARRHGIAVIGGYDPRPFGFQPEDFLDEMHLSAAALSNIERKHIKFNVMTNAGDK
jgi:hypothetical protein